MEAPAGNSNLRQNDFFLQTTLDSIGIKNLTDKSSLGRPHPKFPDKRVGKHDYLRKYEFFMGPFKNRDVPITFLKLGAGPDYNIGASAKTWIDFFGDKLLLIIADIKPSSSSLRTLPNTQVMVGDLGEKAFLKRIRDRCTYDIILDDASHFWGHQILALIDLWEALRPGGLYIIEDLNTSFGELGFQKYDSADNGISCFLFLEVIAQAVTGNRRPIAGACVEKDKENIMDSALYRAAMRLSKEIDAITFISGAAIIIKT